MILFHRWRRGSATVMTRSLSTWDNGCFEDALVSNPIDGEEREAEGQRFEARSACDHRDVVGRHSASTRGDVERVCQAAGRAVWLGGRSGAGARRNDRAPGGGDPAHKRDLGQRGLPRPVRPCARGPRRGAGGDRHRALLHGRRPAPLRADRARRCRGKSCSPTAVRSAWRP